RRRHTRFSRDWSSDVCLPISGPYCHLKGAQYGKGGNQRGHHHRHRQRHLKEFPKRLNARIGQLVVKTHRNGEQEEKNKGQTGERSEERRVGKERRSRKSP